MPIGMRRIMRSRSLVSLSAACTDGPEIFLDAEVDVDAAADAEAANPRCCTHWRVARVARGSAREVLASDIFVFIRAI